VKSKIHIEGVAGMDVTVAHDGAPFRNPVAAIVNRRLESVMSVIRPEIMPHLVGDDDDVPVAAIGRTNRRRKRAVYTPFDRVPISPADASDIADAAVAEITAAAKHLDEVIFPGIFVCGPVGRKTVQTGAAERFAAVGPQPYKFDLQFDFGIALVDVADGADQLHRVGGAGVYVAAEDVAVGLVAVDREAGQPGAPGGGLAVTFHRYRNGYEIGRSLHGTEGDIVGQVAEAFAGIYGHAVPVSGRDSFGAVGEDPHFSRVPNDIAVARSLRRKRHEGVGSRFVSDFTPKHQYLGDFHRL